SATGRVGPLTKASLNASANVTTITNTTTQANVTGGTSVKYTRALKVGSTGDDVKQLQQFLNTNGFTVAPSGAGSPGNETTYMGKLTVEAIKKFQVKYDIASSGTPETTGYGALGPKTRAKLNELIGQ
ncbi:MAG: peptidoglycan-binding domain-containing protein, partial [bacterium]|nr:peptidoglycan-binding domain-containing protein [bacterium]